MRRPNDTEFGEQVRARLDDSAPIVHLRTLFTTTATVIAVDPALPEGGLARHALAERIPVVDETRLSLLLTC